ncbi:hypothetical protein SRB17_05840 [Streptomyces sp. RB17]|nr:hypothetical protein [Streptomyces sp. RB17]
MRDHHRLRRLVLPDGTVYRWTVRHKHADGDSCREVLGLYRDGGYTRIVFREGEAGSGRYVAGGYWYAGCVADGRGGLLEAAAVTLAAAATPGVPPGCPPGP